MPTLAWTKIPKPLVDTLLGWGLDAWGTDPWGSPTIDGYDMGYIVWTLINEDS